MEAGIRRSQKGLLVQHYLSSIDSSAMAAWKQKMIIGIHAGEWRIFGETTLLSEVRWKNRAVSGSKWIRLVG